MYTLIDTKETEEDLSDAASAVQQMAESTDEAFIPVLIELLAAVTDRETLDFNVSYVLPALQRLSRQNFEYDTRIWGEWWGRRDHRPYPDSFARWKADLLGTLDPEFRDFFIDDTTGQLYSGAKSKIDISEVVWGGVMKDDGTGFRSIPSLVNPRLIKGEEASYLHEDDRVFGVFINGDSRAYPLRIMNWHELFNDVVGGRAVALAYCTLCGAGILYDATPGQQTYTFRTSGLLYQSNKLMYDVETNTLWNQFTGTPVIGGLADSDIELEVLPVVLTTWQEWLLAHQETKVLSLNTGYRRDYSPEGTSTAAYTDYFADPEVWFPVYRVDPRLQKKQVVYGLEIGNASRAYPMDTLIKNQFINDSLGGEEIVLITDPESKSVRAYLRDGVEFALKGSRDEEPFLLDSQGNSWRIEESALVREEGERKTLARLSGHQAFWFAWSTFHPSSTVYGLDSEE